jgi:hypothetical protein
MLKVIWSCYSIWMFLGLGCSEMLLHISGGWLWGSMPRDILPPVLVDYKILFNRRCVTQSRQRHVRRLFAHVRSLFSHVTYTYLILSFFFRYLFLLLISDFRVQLVTFLQLENTNTKRNVGFKTLIEQLAGGD